MRASNWACIQVPAPGEDQVGQERAAGASLDLPLMELVVLFLGSIVFLFFFGFPGATVVAQNPVTIQEVTPVVKPENGDSTIHSEDTMNILY